MLQFSAPDVDATFGTGLFADVTLRQKGNVLEVTLVENPVINQVAFEGNDKISDEDKKVIEEAAEEAKKVAAKEDADKDELEKAGKDLSEKLMPIGAKMYEQAQKDAPAESEQSSDDDKKDEPVEGEVVDEK